MTNAHDCRFDEVVIGEDDENGVLKAGMRVLIPCPCGETPFDHQDLMEGYFAEAQEAIKQLEPFRFLFHWSPASRRKQIVRYGLRPFSRLTVSAGEDVKWAAPYVCFADSPAWAWALSGGMRWTPSGQWDLWQTSLDRLTAATIVPADWRPSGIYEVRNEARVYKRDLWLVGHRMKP